jgi:hypothetical protein
MASIITATVSSGLTQQADNSGVLQLASGTGNLVTVPSVTGTAMVSGNMPAFSAYATTDQSVTSNTNTKITFSTEDFDTASCFASSTFTPNVAGYYQINGILRGKTTTTLTDLFITLYKNGSAYARAQNGTGASAEAQVVGSWLVFMNGSTDYLELYGVVTSGGTNAFGANSAPITSRFSGSLVRTS